MALNNHRITIAADTVVDEVRIANYGAILDVDTNDLTLYTRYIDKEACKTHKDLIRADQVAFEDYAYSLQDTLKG